MPPMTSVPFSISLGASMGSNNYLLTPLFCVPRDFSVNPSQEA